MPLNLADRLAVRRNITGRCGAVVAEYAYSLLALPTATAQQKAWARETLSNPEAVGERASWHVLNDPAFIADGSGITDEQLTAAVRAALDSRLIG